MGSHGKTREREYPHTFGMIVRQPNGLFARYLKGDFTHMNMSAKDIAEWAGESIGDRNADTELYNAVHGHGYDWFEIALKWIEETNGKRRANKRRQQGTLPQSEIERTPRPHSVTVNVSQDEFDVFKWSTPEGAPLWLSFEDALRLRGELSEWIALKYGALADARAEAIGSSHELSGDGSVCDALLDSRDQHAVN